MQHDFLTIVESGVGAGEHVKQTGQGASRTRTGKHCNRQLREVESSYI